MPSKERDADGSVDDDAMREKARRSKSERKPDRDRPHRSSKSARSSSDTHSLASSTRRHRKRESDRDRERDRDRDRERDREKDQDRDRLLPQRPVSMSDLTVDAMSRLSIEKDRISLPYPSFDKAHSKEAVSSREDIGSATSPTKPPKPPTPEPADGPQGIPRSASKTLSPDDIPHGIPDIPHGISRSASKTLSPDTRSSKRSSRSRPPTPPDTDVSAARKRAEEALDRGSRSTLSRSASRAAEEKSSRVSRRSSTSAATLIRSPTNRIHDKLRSSVLSRSSSTASHSRHSSSKRSSSTRSAKKNKPEPLHVDSSPSSAQDSSPKTPTQAHQFPSHLYGTGDSKRSRTPASGLDGDDYASTIASGTATPAIKAPSHPPPPIPPPPPPPAIDVLDVPRVDYLLQNGGLSAPVTRHFMSVLPRPSTSTSPLSGGAETLFTPFISLLDQYNTVLTRQGSVAVATGHRSVARRLLDRLENVFSRDLPPHGCSCIICEKSSEPHRGLNWGDVLEWVSGRIELPQWPPFDLADIGSKAAEVSGETPKRPDSPIQLDPDIAEEFREHYLRQSKKVRSAVDKWLHSTGETPVPPPQEVDDETLSFAILTNLDADDRPFFNALLSGSKELRPATRAPTPLNRPRNDFIVKTGLALQRLYRLQQVPRDAESVTYLIKNRHTHDLLITLSNINAQEWEILTSGRFDGFLWSGADGDDFGGIESRGPTPFRGGGGPSALSSRNGTPFSPYSRNATPASFVSLTSSGTGMGGGSRPPVSNDEEMEMAAIAEIEREIYQGMEALEDAFEKLHHQAETVRTALRQRGAGLMQNLQSRKRIDVLSIPGSGNSLNSAYERPAWAESDAGNASDEDWQMDEYDLYPDDSASNISSSRHRRPKRRVERRTPAPIEEEEE